MQPTFLDVHIIWKLKVGNFFPLSLAVQLSGAGENKQFADIFEIWHQAHQAANFFVAQLASFSRVLLSGPFYSV